MFGTALRGGLSVLLLLVALCSFSQQKLPNTLLWRISGGGLAKPSYLYGTMHLADKRLFNFGDSVYYAIENTDGLALEIDFKEYMDSAIRSGFETAQERLLEEKQVRLNRSRLSKTGDSLLRRYGIKGNIATKKQLKDIRDKRMSAYLNKGEMPTIVDAYLLGLAMRQGKWTGAVEDVADQINLSDELGGALEPENVLVAEADFQKGVEGMIAVYLRQDIEAMDKMDSSWSAEDKDAMLTNRNRKMAHRMDSLAQLRPMFFAVGAAHLAGEAGVIRLLKAKGFTVEPVFSKSTLAGEVYASRLRQRPWVPVTGEDSVFTVSMPGAPSDYNAFGNMIKMKMHFDITTMTFYMVGNITANEISEDILDKMIQGAIDNMTSQKMANKPQIITVQSAGLAGREAQVSTDDGVYRMRVFAKDKTAFLLMVAAVKKANISLPETEKFFNSFRPGNTTVRAVAWETFAVPEKGFSVRFPGKPTIDRSSDTATSDWHTISYSTYNVSDGHHYSAWVAEMDENSYLDGDSVFIDNLLTNYREQMDTIYWQKRLTYQGFPAWQLSGYYKNADGIYHMLHVVRGNRRYLLLAGAQKDVDSTGVSAFLHSLQLLPYGETTISTQAKDGFSTSSPGAFVQTPSDSTLTEYQADYYAHNPVDAVSYALTKQVFPPLYWATSDTAYFDTRVESYVSYNDTVLRKQWVQNDGVTAVDAEIGMPGYNSIKKIRLMVSKDTLYTLFAMIPKQYIGQVHHQRFFDDFRLANGVQPTLYTRKVQPLMQALNERDSARFAVTRQTLDDVEFESGDIPQLLDALIHNYRDSLDNYSSNDKLIDVLGNLRDSSGYSFIPFVNDNYSRLSGERENLKYYLLELLAKEKTSAAYTLMKELWLKQTPTRGIAYRLRNALQDSLSLAAILFPQALALASDSTNDYSVAIIANELLTDSLLQREVLQPYAPQIVKGAKAEWLRLKENKEAGTYTMSEWVDLLGWLNTPEAVSLVRQVMLYKDAYLKQSAITALLKNGLSAPVTEVTKVAADKRQRSPFYHELKGMGKLSLFPALYASQKSLAESDLYNYLDEEYEDYSLTYVGERIETYKGNKQLFQLFKIGITYDDEPTQYFLAIAGPYAIGAKERLPYSDLTGIYNEEEFSTPKIAKQLKAYLAMMEPTEE